MAHVVEQSRPERRNAPPILQSSKDDLDVSRNVVGPSDLLNDLYSAIQRRTHGLLPHLSLDVVDGAVILEASAESYYAVQLALAAIQAFVADLPRLRPAKMLFRVNGYPLVLGNHHAGGNRQSVESDESSAGNNSLLLGQHDDKQTRINPLAVATAAM